MTRTSSPVDDPVRFPGALRDAKDAKDAREEYTRRISTDFDLPTRPEVMLDANRVLEGFAPDLHQAIAVIRQDIALAASILREANRHPLRKGGVTSIGQAVLLLGIRASRKVVNRLFLKARMIRRDPLSQELRTTAIRAATLTAFAAEQINQLSPRCQEGTLPHLDPEEAYTLGLLHDCGIPTLMEWFPEYAPLFHTVHDRHHDDPSCAVSLVQMELEKFGIDHGQVGGLLCQLWKLPKPFCEVVRTHHTFIEPPTGDDKASARQRYATTLQCALHIAEWLGHEMPPVEWALLQPRVSGFLALTGHELALIQQAMPVAASVEGMGRDSV
jgi:HD-like signal output (HDOD) protein